MPHCRSCHAMTVCPACISCIYIHLNALYTCYSSCIWTHRLYIFALRSGLHGFIKSVRVTCIYVLSSWINTLYYTILYYTILYYTIIFIFQYPKFFYGYPKLISEFLMSINATDTHNYFWTSKNISISKIWIMDIHNYSWISIIQILDIHVYWMKSLLALHRALRAVSI